MDESRQTCRVLCLNEVRLMWVFGTILLTGFCCRAGELATEGIDQQWLKSVISIEVQDGNSVRAIGTGFVYGTTNFRCILVTAAHVITNSLPQNAQLAYRLVNLDGTSSLLTESYMRSNAPGTWFISTNADVACRYILASNMRAIVAIPRQMLLRQGLVRSGAPLCVAGFPMGIRSETYPTPILRRGIVSISETRNFLIDSAVYPGNSGGPVIYVPTIKLNPDQFSVTTRNTDAIIGIVSEVIPYVDVAVSQQTRRPRITFEEYSGLCRIVSADFILDLIDRPDVKQCDQPMK